MKYVLPKKFLTSNYRKNLWKNAKRTLEKLERVLPIQEAYVVGSFISDKIRPADVDFFIMLKVKDSKKARWSFDTVIVPNNKQGTDMLNDAEKWTIERYKSNAGKIRIK
jgi:hypothetical protein